MTIEKLLGFIGFFIELDLHNTQKALRVIPNAGAEDLRVYFLSWADGAIRQVSDVLEFLVDQLDQILAHSELAAHCFKRASHASSIRRRSPTVLLINDKAAV